MKVRCIKMIKKDFRYSLQMINRNGYTIKRGGNTVEALKSFATFYPLDSFFVWIFDNTKNEMLYQSIYSKKFKKCSNETFVPYF